MFICSSSFFAHGTSSSLGHHEFKPVFYRGPTRMPTSWGVVFFQDKNANKLRIFLWESSGRRLANVVRPQASFPRTTKDKPVYRCRPIINSKKILSRTPNSYLLWSWAHDPEDSKNDPLVCARNHRADTDPSLIVSIGHISWLMVGLLALTTQKQLAKSRQAVS